MSLIVLPWNKTDGSCLAGEKCGDINLQWLSVFRRRCLENRSPSLLLCKNGTASRQPRYSVWLLYLRSLFHMWQRIPLWSFTQRQHSASLPHINTPLSWLHLWASCFTAMWCFEWGCIMLLEGEGHTSVKELQITGARFKMLSDDDWWSALPAPLHIAG